MWVVGESLAERGVPMWFVGEQRRSFCGRSRWMVGWAALGGLPVSCRGESSGNFRPLSHGSQPSRVASILPTAEVSHSRQRENNRPALTWPTRQKQPKKESLQPRKIAGYFTFFDWPSSISVAKWKTARSKPGTLFHEILHLKEKKRFSNALNFPCASMCKLLWIRPSSKNCCRFSQKHW